MVTNWSVRLEKHQTIELLLMVDVLRIFKMLQFSFFFEIFEIHQYFLVKLLNALNFIWKCRPNTVEIDKLVHIRRLLFYDYCTLPASMYEFKNRFRSIIFFFQFSKKDGDVWW